VAPAVGLEAQVHRDARLQAGKAYGGKAMRSISLASPSAFVAILVVTFVGTFVATLVGASVKGAGARRPWAQVFFVSWCLCVKSGAHLSPAFRSYFGSGIRKVTSVPCPGWLRISQTPP
jgi:hypothetical protein